MWILRLNDMRSSQIELTDNVARSDDPKKLQQWLDLERVEPYRDGNWHKVFRKGSLLEWYNDPFSSFDQGIVNVGSQEDWVNNAIERYKTLSESIYSIE